MDWTHLVQQSLCLHCVSFLHVRFNTYITFRLLIRPPYQLLVPIAGPNRRVIHSVLTWIQPAKETDQWRSLANTDINLLLPSNAGKLSSRSASVTFSKTTKLYDGGSLTKWTVGQSGLDFDLQTGEIAANRSISLGKVEFSFR